MKTKSIVICLIVLAISGALVYFGSQNSSPSFKKISDIVYNNPQTGSVWQVVESIKAKLLKDPESYVSVKWYQVQKNPNGDFEVRHRFSARNDKGEATDPVTLVFTLDSSGSVLGCHE